MAIEMLGMDAIVPDNIMTPDPLDVDSVVRDNRMMLNPLAPDYSLNAGCYPGPNWTASQSFKTADEGLQNAFGEAYDQSNFTDAMSSFTYLRPPMQEQHPLAPTVNPTNMCKPQYTVPSTINSDPSPRTSSSSVKIEDDGISKPTPETVASLVESDSSLRARHAADERHNRAKKARRDSQQSNGTGSDTDEKKVRLRAKNKVAAAKCRQRQRKQAQSIQEKGGRLSEANAQLKAGVQELRGELNGLRAMALYHQVCNCQVAEYNYNQARRYAAKYSSTYMGHGSPDYHVYQAEGLPTSDLDAEETKTLCL